MERQRHLIMKEGTVHCPPEYDRHPVFVANQKTNEQIAHRRAQLRTSRERACEKLIRMGEKWERERCKVSGIDELAEAERLERVRLRHAQEDSFNEEAARLGNCLLRLVCAKRYVFMYELSFMRCAPSESRIRTTPSVSSN